MKPLCDTCMNSLNNTRMGQGGYVDICETCSIMAAADYIINNNRVNMETIKSKKLLHGFVKRRLEDNPEDKFEWPQR